MQTLAACAFVAVLLAFAAGCGSDRGGETGDVSDPAAAELEATLDRAVDAPDTGLFCEILSPRQLTESFGKSDPLERCLERVERRPGADLTTYEIEAVEGECARVLVGTGGGQEALFYMREVEGDWLVNDIEDPSTPTEGRDPVCYRVQLFGEDGATGD
jgi:hypothetical protein